MLGLFPIQPCLISVNAPFESPTYKEPEYLRLPAPSRPECVESQR
jgi:hypothetical protein